MQTFASLFTCGGGADIGAMAAGLKPIWGIELNPEVAAYYEKNIGPHIRVGDVTLQNPADFERPDVLWASPPCPNFSVAKTGRKETEQDIALSSAVIRFIEYHRPEYLFLENVRAYNKSESFALIRQSLCRLGYHFDEQVLNAADYGVPQTRQRFIVRARLGDALPPLPEKQGWKGWYQAVEDLLPNLEETQLANWQLKRLPPDFFEQLQASVIVEGSAAGEDNKFTMPVRGEWEPVFAQLARQNTPRAVLVENQNTRRDATLRNEDEPYFTVSVSVSGRRQVTMPAAVLIAGESGFAGSIPTAYGDEPCFTNKVSTLYKAPLRAVLIGDQKTGESGVLRRDAEHPAFTMDTRPASKLRACTGYRIVKMNSRCMARFQSFPDWYELPEKNVLAANIIGNAVPPLMAEAIIGATISQ